MPTLEIESRYNHPVGGVDEVGRGPWAGPVVASVAVFLDPPSLPTSLLEGIQDSKKLSKLKRESIYEELMILSNFQFGIGLASVDEIDQLNITKATFLAMERAIQQLPQLPPTLLIDGKHIPSFNGTQTVPLIGGDSISLSIAAASIIAKVTRDQMMHTLSIECPPYGWERNVGYGTAQHQEALKIHGITPHHRKSFNPIRMMVEKNVSRETF